MTIAELIELLQQLPGDMKINCLEYIEREPRIHDGVYLPYFSEYMWYDMTPDHIGLHEEIDWECFLGRDKHPERMTTINEYQELATDD